MKFLETVKEQSHILRLFSTYAFSNIISKLIPFVALPLILKDIGATEYGIWSLYLMILTVTAPIMLAGVQHHINRNFSTENKTQLASDLHNMALQMLGIMCIFYMVVLALNSQVKEFLSIPVQYFLIAPLVIVSMAIQRVQVSLLMFHKRAVTMAVFDVGRTVSFYTITLVILFMSSLQWQALFAGYCVSSILFGGISAVLMIREGWFSGTLNWDTQRELIKTNTPLIANLMLSTLILTADKVMLEMFLGTDAVGIYTLGFTIASFVLVIRNAVLKVWSPWAKSKLDSDIDSDKIAFVRYAYLYVVFTSFVAFSISIAGYFYVLWAINDQAFYPATQVIPLIAFSNAIAVFAQIGEFSLNHAKKTFALPTISIITLLLNLTLNFIMIPSYGIWGAALATCLTFIVRAYISIWFSQKYMPLPWIQALKISKGT
ncbi:MAG: oligosaccharide flippase family protein [Alphaproteobacteria bacterium]|jgi:O-antigen/teichoic acid export membrane protein|nr:oligosaccharide flippase family protein [Alphaproteobacteria bacterium]MDP7222672.1 oligosaccharide flippase family protein [Alphaproteobacteria bacterium]